MARTVAVAPPSRGKHLFQNVLSAPVVPRLAVGGIAQALVRMQQELAHETEQLAPAIEAQLAVARAQRMPVQDHEALGAAMRERLQPPEELQLFRRVELFAEAAEGRKYGALAEDEGAGGPPERAAERV